MYASLREPGAARAGTLGRPWRRVSRNVVLLGATSLFTDVSSEMLTAVLPLYFMLELRMSPLEFGLVDGLYQGVSAMVRVASGVVADRRGRYKAVAVAGYAISAACKLLLLLVGTAWATIAAILMADRLGKGIRTAPRDALITLSSDRARLGEAFGVHRAMDTVGAVLGPVVAFWILAVAPGAYDAVFAVSLAVAIIGLAVLVTLVQNVAGRIAPGGSADRSRILIVLSDRRFRTLVAVGGLLGLLTASDAMIYMLLHRRGAVSATAFPLLFVGTATTYLLLAMPFGRLGDRVGKHRLFVAGHVAIVGVYGVLLSPIPAGPAALASTTLLGVYYAATDGILAGLAGSMLRHADLTTGLALVTTVAAMARLLAATGFGAMWTWVGPSGALTAFALALTTSTALAAVVLDLRRAWPPARET
jgi:MFS family permease